MNTTKLSIKVEIIGPWRVKRWQVLTLISYGHFL